MTEEVVLLDEAGRAVGTAPKAAVHTDRTPLHLAFSCYVFDCPLDRRPSLLVTRRAEHKRTWPGVWTNSFCGHPGPGEELAGAVRRRAHQELGVALTDLRLVLPAFRYTATMPDGTRENELCPVFAAVTSNAVQPDAEEVAEAAWVPWEAFADEVLTGARTVSPWCVEQVEQLRRLPGGSLAAADPASLPPAARLARSP
jgi:isopentenyl-diphosphate delta-isomerase